jgi:hypothetical protein
MYKGTDMYIAPHLAPVLIIHPEVMTCIRDKPELIRAASDSGGSDCSDRIQELHCSAVTNFTGCSINPSVSLTSLQ